MQLRDHQLLLDQQLFRNVGANIPDLFERFLTEDEASATQALVDANAAGIRFVRFAALPRSAATYALFTSDRARWLAAFDRMLTVADSHDIALIPSLLYDARTLPQVAGGASAPATDLLAPGSPAEQLGIAYVTALVTRYQHDPRILFWEIGNEYNRLADRQVTPESPTARQSPGAQTATAPSLSDRQAASQSPADQAAAGPSRSDLIRAFLGRIAAVIHKIDHRHLVTSGNGELRPYAAHLPHHWPAGDHRYLEKYIDVRESDTFAQYQEMIDFFNPPGIDIISIHQSPPGAETVGWLVEDDAHALRVSWAQYAAINLGKPLFVGAFGQALPADGKGLPPPWLLDFLRRMQAEGSPPAAISSWEPGRLEENTAEAISPTRTPQLAFAVKVVNTVIANMQANSFQVLTVGPPLDLSDKAMQADRERKANDLPAWLRDALRTIMLAGELP